MKIEVSETGEIVLKEVYQDIWLETEEGNRMGLCMRDDTFELIIEPISFIPAGRANLYRVDMKSGEIKNMEDKS